MASSTSFDAVNRVSSRFHTQRINRRLDDRDNVIKEAIAILEEKDRAYFPTVEAVTFSHPYSAANVNGKAQDIVVTLTGTQLGKTTGDSFSIRLAGLANTSSYTYFTTITPAAANAETSLAFTIDMSVFAAANGLDVDTTSMAAGNFHLLQVHVNETLATELMIQLA